jgi:hypothetical protein
MTGRLQPADEALRRYFADADEVDAMHGGVLDRARAKALVVEGDLTLDRTGLLSTAELLPDLLGTLTGEEYLVAVIVTGDLIAPNLVLMEPDYDWSPRFKVGGTLHVKSLCLGGSAAVVGGDLIAEDTVFGFYNHGRLQVGGRTTANVILASDYAFDFAGEVTCPHVLSCVGRLNIPARFEQDDLHLALHPEVIDDRNNPKDAEIIQRLQRGKSILRPKNQIGRPPKRALTKQAKERLATIAAREAAGETIITVDLGDCELRFVPEEIRRFTETRRLRLAKNAIPELPLWVAEYPHLETLDVSDCELALIPTALAYHPALRRLFIDHNKIIDLPAGPYPVLEHLCIGRGFDDDHVNFVANLDLAQFPALRYAELGFSGLPRLRYSATADLWDCPTLEYLEIGGILDGLPHNLAKAKRIRGFACSLPKSSVAAARALKAQWPDLEALSLGYGGLSGDEVASIAAALPGVYVRVESCADFRLELEHPLYRLNGSVGSHLYQANYAAAAREAELLLPELGPPRMRFEAGFIEEALRHCMDAFTYDTAKAEGDEKIAKVLRAADLADRILALLPKSADVCWLIHQRDLGLLRLSCQLAQALRHFRGPAPDKAAALRILDAAQLEADAYMDKTNAWFVERASLIGGMRERVMTAL